MEGGRRWENEAVEGRKCERMCLRREIKYTQRGQTKKIFLLFSVFITIDRSTLQHKYDGRDRRMEREKGKGEEISTQ